MIWLVGNRGMLGTELSGLFEAEGRPFVGSDRELSILDPEALRAFAAGKGITWIVNCAAYTAVDRAEDEIGPCTALNVEGPRNLALLAADLDASLIHISTDYVFSGLADRPYQEDDPLGPTGVYGRTKAAGEKAVLEACPKAIILRTAWLYGRHGPNFVFTMLRLMKERDEIGVVADQKGTPTWAADLSRTILGITGASTPRYGTYHFTDGGQTNWYEFALEIRRLASEAGLVGGDCRVKSLGTAEYPTKAKRPAYSVLSKDKIVRDYGVAVPDWKESLRAFIGQLARDPLRQQ